MRDIHPSPSVPSAPRERSDSVTEPAKGPASPQLHRCLLKRGTELAVSVVDEVLSGREEAPCFHRHVARDLHHPGFMGMRGYACNVDPPTPQVDEKQDVIRHQPAERPYLRGEEVRCDEHVHVRANEGLPGARLFALRGWLDTMALENIATV